MYASIMFLAIAAPAQAPCPPQAPPCEDCTVTDRKTVEPCCSSACTCGCNEGAPCRCGNPVIQQQAPSTHTQHHTPMLRESMLQPIYAQPLQAAPLASMLQPVPPPATMSEFRFAPTYSVPFFQGSGRSCGSGG